MSNPGTPLSSSSPAAAAAAAAAATAASPPPKASETYSGSCHCERFAFSITQSPPLTDPACKVTECNCSICTRNAYLLVIVPDANITWEQGSVKELKKYTFGGHKYAHYFCPSCGTSCIVKDEDASEKTTAVNVRTLKDLDVKELNLKQMDGKSYNG